MMRAPTGRVVPIRRFLVEKGTRDKDPIDPKDIRLLSAPNFFLLARQEGVHIMRTTMGELDAAVTKAEDQERLSILLPDLTEGAFHDLLRGQRDTRY